MRRALLTTAAASFLVTGALVPATATADGPGDPAGSGEQPGEGCTLTDADLPVCPAEAPADTASFLDPSADVVGGRHVTLAERVYVGPFARLVASAQAPISVGTDTNIQDNVSVVASRALVEGPQGGAPAAEGGVEIADRVILAHGSSVIGPATIGIGGTDIPADPDDDQEVFLSFGSQVDGAVLERNTGISALGRVGPGITLKSGRLVLPGKNVTTQAEADDPALGKVRLINESDVAFNEAVIEVNIAFAREYTELYREDPDALSGVNVNPGGTDFNPDRDLPVFAGRSWPCRGTATGSSARSTSPTPSRTSTTSPATTSRCAPTRARTSSSATSRGWATTSSSTPSRTPTWSSGTTSPTARASSPTAVAASWSPASPRSRPSSTTA
jgi:carbonic anhydrase/acetyltransferase-like protein (isoleucine patch superfamily)